MQGRHMIRRIFLKAAALSVLCSPAFAADPLPKLQETPMLAEQVKSGALPAVDKRVPKQPMVVTKFAGGDGPGQPGGQLNMLVASARDTRLMTVYSYTRLIVYTPEFKLQPDILESYENKDDKEFTFKLREGHKWSDGQPPKVEIIDARTIKFTWDKPNPYFIESQARAAPLFLFRPAHYLKKFHAKYTPEKEILKSAKGGQQSGRWTQVYRRMDAMFANDNVDLPSLNPWINTT